MDSNPLLNVEHNFLCKQEEKGR